MQTHQPVGLEAPADDPQRSTGILRSRRAALILLSAGVAGLVIPTVAYFTFIHQYAVNVPYADQWYSDVPLLGKFYSHTLTLGSLWTPHFDHRMLFPNLIVLALAESTHFNIVFEDYLGGLFLVVAVGLLIAAHKRRSPSTPLVYYCPVALLMFSFVQFQNSLWGFQIAWYLVMLMLALAILLLDRPTLGRLALTGAIGAAAVGSFSSLQGLLIWPIGLVLLLQRRRPAGPIVAWVASAVITGGVYFYHLAYWGPSNRLAVLAHPMTALKFFFFSIGAVVGNQATNPATHPSLPTMLLGVVVFSVAVWVVIVLGLRRDTSSGSPIGVALVLFGLLFAVVITQGRAWSSLLPYEPRYTTYNLLVLVGCYLALLDRLVLRFSPRRMQMGSLPVAEDAPGHFDGQPTTVDDRGPRGSSMTWTVIGTVVMGVIGLQVILGIGDGLASARSWSDHQKTAADIAVNAHAASDTLMRTLVNDPALIRQSVAVIRRHNLCLFATAARAQYSKAGLLPDLTNLRTRIAQPLAGATLRKTQLLIAGASDLSGVDDVEFLLVDQRTMHSSLVAKGTRTPYGWLAYWDTARVADGRYVLQSLAFGPDGRVSHSPTVRITINNSD